MAYFIVGPKIKTREAAGLFFKAKNIHRSAAELIDALHANNEVKLFNSEKEAMDYSIATAEYAECTAMMDYWGITLHPVYEVNLSSEVNLNSFTPTIEEHISVLDSKDKNDSISQHTFKTLPLSAISETVTAKIPEPVRQKMLLRNLKQSDAHQRLAEPRVIDLTVENPVNTYNNCVIL